MAYFFCSFDNLKTQDPANIISSLLRQASTLISGITDEVLAGFNEWVEEEARTLSMAEMESMLVRYVKQLDRFIVIVDAVNESESKANITKSLARLASQLGNLHMIVSSTAEHGLVEEKYGCRFSVVTAEMQSNLVDADIQLYLHNTLDRRSAFGPDLKLEVEQSIMKESRGTFRYASWQAENIMGQRTGRAARRALSEMPHNLNQTYSQLMSRIRSEQDQTYLRRALSWLCCASRPLRLTELNEAIVIEEGDTEIDDECRLLDDPGFLIDLAQGLLELNIREREDGVVEPIVSLSHSSIKVFLTSDWIRTSSAAKFAFEEHSAHKSILQICLNYLTFFSQRIPVMMREWPSTRSEKQLAKPLRTEYPLADYAAQNWPLHVRHALQEASDWLIIKRFLYNQFQSPPPQTKANEGNLGNHYLAWVRLITGGNTRDEILNTTRPLYYASSFGYKGLVEAMLKYDKSAISHLESKGGR